MTDPVVRDTARTLVQTATTLPPDDSGWTTQRYLRHVADEDAHGLVVGSAEFTQVYGERIEEAMIEPLLVGPAPDIYGDTGSTLLGQVVRILVEDIAGTVRIDDATWTPYWWGILIQQDTSPDGGDVGHAGGGTRWMAAGLPAVLDAIAIREGWARDPVTPTVVTRLGYLPPFNALPLGDRSLALAEINGVPGIYPHDVSTDGSVGRWTAAQIVDLLLALATPVVEDEGTPRGWHWLLSDPTNALAYEPERLELNGQTIFQAIAELISEKRALTWWCTVDHDVVTIHVQSTVAAAVTVGTYTLPAAAATASLTIVGNATLAGVRIVEDHSSVYDIIEVRGGCPWMTMTLAYGSADPAADALGQGWSSPQRSGWDDDSRNSGCDTVFRRFRIMPQWSGFQFGFGGTTDVGLRSTLATEHSDAYGAGGLTGERTFDGIASPPAFSLVTERELPMSDGFGILRMGPRQQPIALLSSGDGSWTDISQAVNVQVEDSPPAVVIDDHQWGEANQADLEGTGQMLLVTIGIRESQPLRVSWQRDPAQWPRAAPRIKVIDIPTLEQWVALAGTVIGVTGDLGTTERGVTGSLATLSVDEVIRDDLPTLRGLLAIFVARFSVPDIAVDWTDRGILDHGDELRPGALLTTVDRGDRTMIANAVITGRSRRMVTESGVERWDTSYTTRRVLPDTTALLRHA